MRFFYIDVVNQEFKAVVMEDKLQNYYNALHCDCIDITQIEVEGVEFDVICDDEGLLKENITPSIYINDDYMIFGNVLLCHSENGELTTILPWEISMLKQNLALAIWKGRPITLLTTDRMETTIYER